MMNQDRSNSLQDPPQILLPNPNLDHPTPTPKVCEICTCWAVLLEKHNENAGNLQLANLVNPLLIRRDQRCSELLEGSGDGSLNVVATASYLS